MSAMSVFLLIVLIGWASTILAAHAHGKAQVYREWYEHETGCKINLWTGVVTKRAGPEETKGAE